MTATTAPGPPPRPGASTVRATCVALLWVAAIAAAALLPGGGLAVSLLAVSTTYRRASMTTRVTIVVVGVLTVLLQASTAIVWQHDVTGSVHRVQ